MVIKKQKLVSYGAGEGNGQITLHVNEQTYVFDSLSQAEGFLDILLQIALRLRRTAYIDDETDQTLRADAEIVLANERLEIEPRSDGSLDLWAYSMGGKCWHLPLAPQQVRRLLQTLTTGKEIVKGSDRTVH